MKKRKSFIISLAVAGAVFMSGSGLAAEAAETVGEWKPYDGYAWESISGYSKDHHGVYEIDSESSLSYTVTADGFAIMRGFKGTAEEIEVPSEVDGVSVTHISSFAFKNCTGIRKIILPDTVREINWNAFEGCTGLESVNIPDGVSEIETHTFKNCTSLVSVDIPASVTEIDYEAFAGCSSLSEINISGSISDLSADAFSDTKWYDDKPDGAVCLGDTFYRIKGALPEDKSVKIPDNVKYIADSAFRNCTDLLAVTLPEGLIKIGVGAFAGCSSLTSAVIPAGVEMIKSGAFEGCSGLKTISFKGNSVKTECVTFRNCTSLTSIDIPEGVPYVNEDFSGCTGLVSVTVPGTAAAVSPYSFSGCTSLRSVIISEGVFNLEKCAFEDCPELSKIVIPASVCYISGEAFNGCTDKLTVYGHRNTVAEKYAQINGIKFVDLDAEAGVKPTAAPSPSVTADNKVNSSPNTGDRGISGLITACMSAGLVSVLTFLKKKKLQGEDE